MNKRRRFKAKRRRSAQVPNSGAALLAVFGRLMRGDYARAAERNAWRR